MSTVLCEKDAPSTARPFFLPRPSAAAPGGWAAGRRRLRTHAGHGKISIIVKGGNFMKKCLASFLCVLFFFLPSFALAAFHSDYEAINSAAQSVLRLEVYGRHNTLLGTGSGFVAF